MANALGSITLTEEQFTELLRAHGPSVLRIPARAEGVKLHYASLEARDRFGDAWQEVALNKVAGLQGWFEIDLASLSLADGEYEYEFELTRDGQTLLAADPFAEELTRFSGTRGVFRIRNGQRYRLPFSWADEFRDGFPLANNNELVIYEMPMRWMENAPEDLRQVALGTFEKVVFTRLNELHDLGINAIELLPVQDSADTLAWGYGTRYFFAPDLDMGGPVDLKYFIKQCHRRGIRVIFDIVMNHARECPLAKLDHDSFFLDNPGQEPGRGEDYGADMFRYRSTGLDGTYAAREFHYRMAAFLIREFHADGFRLDEFRGIDHWEFIQTFRDKAWESHQTLYPGRPFIVIAEDSWRRAQITQPDGDNPHGRQVTDSMWNFAYRDEVRRLMRHELNTEWQQPARRERIRWLVGGQALWDDMSKEAKRGFGDLSQAVNYLTSHDVEKEYEKRIMNFLFGPLLAWYGRPAQLEHIRWIADNLDTPDVSDADRNAHGEALERVRSAFALLFTSVGIPMLLAGDEFGDVHDLDNTNWRLKMTDPVDWSRRWKSRNNSALWEHVRDLIALRKSHPALTRNDFEFCYFHPRIDEPQGEGVFVYSRTRGAPLGYNDQVVVVANMGGQGFDEFHVPWPWRDRGRLREIAPPDHRAELALVDGGWAQLSIAPFQTRVFAT